MYTGSAGDVTELWQAPLTTQWLLHARTMNQVKRRGMRTIGDVIGRNSIAAEAFDIYKQHYDRELDRSDEIFNNGVSLLNLLKWRYYDTYLQVEYKFWMQTALDLGNVLSTSTDKRIPWWYVGNQGIMWFVFADDVSAFELDGWHCDGLGWHISRNISMEQATAAKLLHWNGDAKPWLDNTGRHYTLYERYKPQECAGVGSCKLINQTGNVIPPFWECSPADK